MALGRQDEHGAVLPGRTATGNDGFVMDQGDTSERSSVIAFLLGGVVIAGGLFTFLYLDAGTDRPTALTQNDGFIRLEDGALRAPVPTARPAGEAQPVTQ
jgi:hypothetical protein